MRIPNKIKVGATVYTIEVVGELGDSGAEIDRIKGKIKLLKASEDYMCSSLLHEIMHGINMEIGEVEVEFLAQALYQIIKENPEVFKK